MWVRLALAGHLSMARAKSERELELQKQINTTANIDKRGSEIANPLNDEYYDDNDEEAGRVYRTDET